MRSLRSSTSRSSSRAPGTPARLLLINVYGSACVLEAARRVGIKRVVNEHQVRLRVLGPEHGAPTWTPIQEDYPKFQTYDDPGYPFYSTTNKMAEYFGVRLVRKYPMELVIVRFAHTYARARRARGRRSWARMTCVRPEPWPRRWIEAAYRGEPFEISEGGDEADDFVHNADLADGVSRAALSDGCSSLTARANSTFAAVGSAR